MCHGRLRKVLLKLKHYSSSWASRMKATMPFMGVQRMSEKCCILLEEWTCSTRQWYCYEENYCSYCRFVSTNLVGRYLDALLLARHPVVITFHSTTTQSRLEPNPECCPALGPTSGQVSYGKFRMNYVITTYASAISLEYHSRFALTFLVYVTDPAMYQYRNVSESSMHSSGVLSAYSSIKSSRLSLFESRSSYMYNVRGSPQLMLPSTTTFDDWYCIFWLTDCLFELTFS